MWRCNFHFEGRLSQAVLSAFRHRKAEPRRQDSLLRLGRARLDNALGPKPAWQPYNFDLNLYSLCARGVAAWGRRSIFHSVLLSIGN